MTAPAPSPSSMPTGLAALLRFERDWLAAQPAPASSAVRFWFAPQADPVDGYLQVRCASARQGEGCVRCDLTQWPLADGSLAEVVLQHVVDPTGPSVALLAEALRTLEDGGRLWLFGGNPWSPCARAWLRDKSCGWSTSAPRRATALLARLGLTTVELVRLGSWLPNATAQTAAPHWGGMFRSAYAIRAEKRVARIIALPRAQRTRAVATTPLVTTFSATARSANGR